MLDTEVREGWHWPVKDQGAWEWCYKQWNHLPDLILKYVTNTDVCIHAGANVGLYAKQYSKHFDRVLAFEPEPTNFWCLVNNVPEENVVKIQGALGTHHGWCSMVCPSGPINCGGFQMKPGKSVPVMKIDDFSGEVGLIHLDVEGFELEVLKGASETLFYQNPIVCLETINPGQDAQARDFLRQFGYEIAEVLTHDTIYRK